MKKAQDIILRPIITEASMSGIANKKYTFKVANDANKIEIAKAVEELFGVKVKKVNTMNVPGQFQTPWACMAAISRIGKKLS